MWVLIVLTTYRAVFTMHDFETREKCEAAANAVQHLKGTAFTGLYTTCVPK